MAVVMFFNAACAMINTFVNPIALGNMAWRYYIVYIALLTVMLVFVILFFAETKGHSLEEVADIFEGPFMVVGRGRRRSTRVMTAGDVVCDEAGNTKGGARADLVENIANVPTTNHQKA